MVCDVVEIASGVGGGLGAEGWGGGGGCGGGAVSAFRVDGAGAGGRCGAVLYGICCRICVGAVFGLACVAACGAGLACCPAVA